jgi:hypothetical protein
LPSSTARPRAVAGAILLASVVREPEKAPEALDRYLARGLAVLEGKDRWADAAARR